MRARRAIVPLAFLALAALGVTWFFTTFERVPSKERVGMSGEARLRPFLAAERFAERMGMRSAELRSPVQLDALAPQGVLLLPRNRQSLSPEGARRVLAWASGGGHAIVEAERPELPDALLDPLGVKRVARKHVKAPAPLPSGMFNAIILEAELRPGDEPLKVIFSQDLRLEPGKQECVARVTDRKDTALCTVRRGKGLVTATSTLTFARNERIGLHDNAAFLWALAGLTDADALSVYFSPQRLSLWRFLADNAMPALVAGGLLLLAWLWHIAPRFGPVAPDAPPARRRLLDHLRACGRFYWANGLRSRLVVGARDAALRRLSRAQPDFADASQAEKARRLSAFTGASLVEASHFLGAGGQMRGAEFIRVTQQAQRIHSALEKGDR